MNWANGGYDDTNSGDVERANAALEDQGEWTGRATSDPGHMRPPAPHPDCDRPTPERIIDRWGACLICAGVA